ncbi:MAG: hypothetical protein ACI4KR_04425 [Ruminiclostridium sp.]
MYELAKVFAKHNFFNDFDPVDDSYMVLSEIYSALTHDGKEKLHACYKIIKSKENKGVLNQGQKNTCRKNPTGCQMKDI